jgi:hypothetical protein
VRAPGLQREFEVFSFKFQDGRNWGLASNLNLQT